MLSDKQYEAIGRLALAFNEIETVIDQYCPHILGASEREVATVLWDDRANFERKADRFKKIVEAVSVHYGPLKPWGDEIAAIIKSAKELGEQRNQHVHAIVHVNYEKNETLLIIRGKPQPCDEADIRQMAVNAIRLADKLEHWCAGLVGQLYDLRNPAISAALKLD